MEFFFIVRKGDKTLTRQYDRAVFQGSEFYVERNIDTPFCDVFPSFAAHVCWQCCERFLKNCKQKLEEIEDIEKKPVDCYLCKRFSKLQGKYMMRFLLYQNFLVNKTEISSKSSYSNCIYCFLQTGIFSAIFM